MTLSGTLLFGLGQHEGFLWPHPEHDMWELCPVFEPLPRPILMEHIRGAREFWTGVDNIRGMMSGNDVALAEIGFTDGICGLTRYEEYTPGGLDRWLI